VRPFHPRIISSHWGGFRVGRAVSCALEFVGVSGAEFRKRSFGISGAWAFVVLETHSKAHREDWGISGGTQEGTNSALPHP